MAPAYKLTYFNVNALGEPLRFLLSYGDIEYDDVRIADIEEWRLIKDKMPWGQVPVLEHNGKIGHQHIAMSRYLAKQVNLVGKDDWENLEIDAAVDTVNDLRAKIAAFNYEPDETVKATKKAAFFKDTLPYYLEKLEAQVKNNNGHLALSRLTWADLFFVSLQDYFIHMAGEDIIADSPGLVALKQKVLAIPSIKTYVDNRPETRF